MIEIRWLNRRVMIPGNPPIPDNYEERVLQYRQHAGDDSLLPEGIAYNWSDWKDVQEVDDDEQ